MAPQSDVTTAIPSSPSFCPRCDDSRFLILFRGTDRLYRTTDRVFRIVECGACGLIRLDPRPSAEDLATFYPETYWWEADDSTSGRLAELYREIVMTDHVWFAAEALRSPGLVLDVGCGGGSFLNAMQRRGAEAVGADSSSKAAAICWSRFGIPAVCARLPELPFRAGSFALVTLFHVLEHLPDPVAALLALGELIQPGGRLLVQVPNAACWQMMLLGDRWSGLDVPRHLINFRAEDLDDLLGACGFEVRRRKFFSLRDNPAGLATSLFPSLEPMSRKVRGVRESKVGELFKNLLYLALVAASAPFAMLEAAGSAGSTILVEAARPGEE